MNDAMTPAMRALLFVVVFVVVSVCPAFAVITNVSSIGAAMTAGSDTSVTTGTFNSSTASLIVVGYSWNDNGETVTISDDQKNTYTCDTPSAHSVSSSRTRICYVAGPATSATHTVAASATGAGTRVALFVAAFAGTLTAAARDVQNSNESASGTTLTAGSLTPSAAGEVFFTVLAHGNISDDEAVTASIDSSYVEITGEFQDDSPHYGTAAAYKIQTGGASVENPTWTVSSSQPNLAVAHSSFLAVVSSTTSNRLMLMGVGR